jgi:MobA/VirD2-like, nuclease domain
MPVIFALRLTDQPRAVVFHVKPDGSGNGREHCHVVWSRTDVANMKSIHMSHDHAKLCDLSCELAHKYGLELSPGLKAWEEKRKFDKDYLEATMAENAQAKETGITPEQRQAELTAAYSQTDTAQGFQNALLEKGYVLAQGSRRAFVVVDGFGKVHSLTRYVKGYKAKEIKGRLRSNA